MHMSQEAVVVINPGSTSTKIAVWSRQGAVESETYQHPQEELSSFARIAEQLKYRYRQIQPFINQFQQNPAYTIVGVVGRGGIVKPLRGGTYRINEAFLADARAATYGEHASNLGSLMADFIRQDFGLQDSYTVDPVSTSNISEVAKISGVPGIERDGRAHTLNIKTIARKIARRQEIPFAQSHYIMAHLGGGISIGRIKGGTLVDVNDGLLGMGPFAPNRAGALPLRGVMRMCYSMPEAEVRKLFSSESGFKAYLGIEDFREVMDRVSKGDKKAVLVYEAFVYQIAKEVGANYAASKGRAQAIGVTGGIAHSTKFVLDLEAYVGPLTDFYVYPGESEMEALAEGIFRVLDNKEEALEYT